jgi:hypothetical protein
MASKIPIIRHCKNCRYCAKWTSITEPVDCSVKLKRIYEFQRLTALFCRRYKVERGDYI